MIKPLIITTLIMLTSFAAQAKIYKWTDERGQIHFSDMKPTDVKNVVEHQSVTNKAKSGVKRQDVEFWLPGSWQISRFERLSDNLQGVVTGTLTYTRNGLVSSDLVFNNNQMNIPMVVTGTWYQSDDYAVTFTLNKKVLNQEFSDTTTVFVRVIGEKELVIMNSNAEEERMQRVIEDLFNFGSPSEEESAE